MRRMLFVTFSCRCGWGTRVGCVVLLINSAAVHRQSSHVLIRLEEYYVHFRGEQTNQSNCGIQAHYNAECRHLCLKKKLS